MKRTNYLQQIVLPLFIASKLCNILARKACHQFRQIILLMVTIFFDGMIVETSNVLFKLF